MAPAKTRTRPRRKARQQPPTDMAAWDQAGVYASMMLGDLAGEYIAATMPPERRDRAVRAAEHHQALGAVRGMDQ